MAPVRRVQNNVYCKSPQWWPIGTSLLLPRSRNFWKHRWIWGKPTTPTLQYKEWRICVFSSKSVLVLFTLFPQLGKCYYMFNTYLYSPCITSKLLPCVFMRPNPVDMTIYCLCCTLSAHVQDFFYLNIKVTNISSNIHICMKQPHILAMIPVNIQEIRSGFLTTGNKRMIKVQFIPSKTIAYGGEKQLEWHNSHTNLLS